MLLWGCAEEKETYAPLRNSDKTVINTRPPLFVSIDSTILSAEVLEIGPTGISEAGFIISQNPNPTFENGETLKIPLVNKTGPYTAVAKNLSVAKKHHYRFYAKEKEQVLLGSVQTFTTHDISISRVSGVNANHPDDYYEGGAGNYMAVQGSNFSSVPLENALKIGGKTVKVNSVSIQKSPDGNNSSTLYFYLPDDIEPGQYEVSISRAGQTAKAPQLLKILPGKWKKLKDFNAGFKGNGDQYTAHAFAMNGKGYMVGLLPYLPVKLYQYAPETDNWTKLNINLDNNHELTASFGLNGKVFISTGVNQYDYKLNKRHYEIQLHSFDPNTGIQEKKQPSPISYPDNLWNVSITCFTIGEDAYMGGGVYTSSSSYQTVSPKHFYKYSPSTDTWTRIADFPGTTTAAAITFEINGTVYLVTPTHNYKVLPEVWAYNPSTDTWTQKRDFPGQLNYNMAGFSVGAYGYVIGGTYSSFPYKRDFLKYEPATDSWQEVASFDRSLEGMKCFVIAGKAYAVQHFHNNKSFLWEFTPAQ